MTTGNHHLSRRSFLKFSAVVTGGAVLAACAPSAPAPTPQAAAPEAEPAEPTAAPQEAEPVAAEPTPATSRPGVLTIWSMSFPPHQAMMNEAISLYDKQSPDQKVDYQPQPGDYGAKWRAAIAANQGPDAFVIHGSALLELAIGKHLLPVTPDVLTVEEAKRDFMPEMYLQSFYDGNLYALGVPDPPGDAGMVLNLDHFEEAGLTPLQVFESREQMLEYARKLVVKEGDDVLRAGCMVTGEGNFPIYWLSYIVDSGGTFFDNDKQSWTVTTPEAEAALQFFYDIIYKERLDDPALGNNMSDAIPQGLASMAYMWPEFVPYANSAFPDLKLGFTIKPGFQAGKPAIFNHSDTWNLGILSSTQNKDAAVKFLQFCKTRDVQHAMLMKNPGMSPLKAINFDPQEEFWISGTGAYMKPVFDAITKGQYRYYGPFGNMDTIEYDIMWPMINESFQNKRTVKDALQAMEAKLNDEMKTYRQKYADLPPVNVYTDGLPGDLLEGIPTKA